LLSQKSDGKPLWEYFFYYDTGFGWVYGTAGITGVVLLIFLVIMVLCSLPCVRRKGYFEVNKPSTELQKQFSVYLLSAGVLFDPPVICTMVYFAHLTCDTFLEVVSCARSYIHIGESNEIKVGETGKVW